MTDKQKELSKSAEILFEEFLSSWESLSLAEKALVITKNKGAIDLTKCDGCKVIRDYNFILVYSEDVMIFGYKPFYSDTYFKVGEI